MPLPGQQTKVGEPVESVQDAVAVAVSGTGQLGMAGAGVLPARQDEHDPNMQIGRPLAMRQARRAAPPGKNQLTDTVFYIPRTAFVVLFGIKD